MTGPGGQLRHCVRLVSSCTLCSYAWMTSNHPQQPQRFPIIGVHHLYSILLEAFPWPTETDPEASVMALTHFWPLLHHGRRVQRRYQMLHRQLEFWKSSTSIPGLGSLSKLSPCGLGIRHDLYGQDAGRWKAIRARIHVERLPSHRALWHRQHFGEILAPRPWGPALRYHPS